MGWLIGAGSAVLILGLGGVFFVSGFLSCFFARVVLRILQVFPDQAKQILTDIPSNQSNKHKPSILHRSNFHNLHHAA